MQLPAIIAYVVFAYRIFWGKSTEPKYGLNRLPTHTAPAQAAIYSIANLHPPKLTLPALDKLVDKPDKPLYARLKSLFLKGKYFCA